MLLVNDWCVQVKSTIDKVILSASLAKKALYQNFGGIAKLTIAGVAIAETADFYSGGNTETKADISGVHYRYSEWLAWGDDPYQVYNSSSKKGARPVDAFSHIPPKPRGAGLPTHQDVCLNFLFVHKSVDGILGAAFVPGDDEVDEAGSGICSDSYTPVKINHKGLLPNRFFTPQQRQTVIARNTGFVTSYCENCDNGSPGPTDPFSLSRTLTHELGHAFGSPHDDQKHFPGESSLVSLPPVLDAKY